MSVARQTSVDFDLTVLEEAARELGYSTQRNGNVRGWAGRTIMSNADLVIRPKTHSFDLGFKRTEDAVQMKADHHGGHVDKDLCALTPRYMEKLAERESGGRFRNPVRTETEEHIVLRYKF